MVIQKIRMNRQISQVKLSKMIGVSASTISLYESGKREPSIEMLKKLSLVLECTIDELVSDDIV